eukprot:jgi/Botrbrau1/19467/Bobra.0338s0086.3
MVLLQPQTFHWRKDVTPWSSPAAVGLSIGSYLILVFGLRSILKHQVRVPVWITALHNLILCGWSLLLFIGTLSESIKESFSIGGGTWLFCLPKGTAVQAGMGHGSHHCFTPIAHPNSERTEHLQCLRLAAGCLVLLELYVLSLKIL